MVEYIKKIFLRALVELGLMPLTLMDIALNMLGSIVVGVLLRPLYQST